MNRIKRCFDMDSWVWNEHRPAGAKEDIYIYIGVWLWWFISMEDHWGLFFDRYSMIDHHCCWSSSRKIYKQPYWYIYIIFIYSQYLYIAIFGVYHIFRHTHILVGGFKHVFFPFHIWDVILPNLTNSYFSRWLKPATMERSTMFNG